MSRVKELEARNTQLSKLLEGAVAELWEYQKHAADARFGSEDGAQAESGDDLEKLSVAIAKVQFVNVYLGDSSLPLPAEEGGNGGSAPAKDEPAPSLQEPPLDEKEAVPPASPEPQLPVSEAPVHSNQAASDNKLADPSTFDDYEEDAPSKRAEIRQHPGSQARTTKTPGSLPANASPAPKSAKTHLSPAPNRPPLAESSYSWMIGQDSPVDPHPDARKPSSGFFEDQRHNRGFLFGDEDASASKDPAAKQKSSSAKGHKKTASKGEKAGEGDGEEAFDMGSLRRNRPL